MEKTRVVVRYEDVKARTEIAQYILYSLALILCYIVITYNVMSFITMSVIDFPAVAWNSNH